MHPRDFEREARIRLSEPSIHVEETRNGYHKVFARDRKGSSYQIGIARSPEGHRRELGGWLIDDLQRRDQARRHRRVGEAKHIVDKIKAADDARRKEAHALDCGLKEEAVAVAKHALNVKTQVGVSA